MAEIETVKEDGKKRYYVVGLPGTYESYREAGEAANIEGL